MVLNFVGFLLTQCLKIYKLWTSIKILHFFNRPSEAGACLQTLHFPSIWLKTVVQYNSTQCINEGSAVQCSDKQKCGAVQLKAIFMRAWRLLIKQWVDNLSGGSTHQAPIHCTSLNCTDMYCAAIHSTSLQYTELHFNTLQYTALHCTTLHHIASIAL